VYDNRVDGINVQSCGKAELRDSDVFRNGRHGVTVAGGASVVALGCRLNVNGSYAVHAEAHTAQAPTRVTVERSDVRGNRKGAWSLQPGCQVRRRENREPEPAIGWRLIEEGLRQAFDDIAAQFESVLPSDGGRQSAPIDLRRRIEEKLARCDDLVVQIESSLALELLPASSPERRAYHLALELRQLSQQVMSGDPLGADMVAADDRATRALEGLELVLQTLEPAEHS
jgi:hypothetical protein